ncbi:NLR family CARD domain-containing protein 3 [Geodia barretti]|uniref:NLR family CARD domain-containing protein 3 n=1 Tax=Geodia barretti TaxID=519541 RepID=A0AA35TYQ1_GEOBA|nr:NLR family CARD domain-containing protein 3 [Geodia barretti]
MKIQLKTEIKQLQELFIELKDDVFESVKNKPVDTFKVRLISMDVDGVEYHVPFLKEIAHKHESVVNIWMDLSPYLNFLNYEILQHILQKFKDPALQIRMDTYIEKIKKFFKTTRLRDFLKCWPVRGKTPPAGDLRKFLTTKTTKDWNTCTLEDLDNVRQNLAKRLLLPSFALDPADASEGCVTMTYYIPASIVPQLQTDIKNTLLKDFADMEIETITVDGVVCYEAPLLQYTSLLKQMYTSWSPLQPLSDSKPKPLLPFRLARIEKQSLSPSDMDRFTRESLRGDMDDVVYKKTAMELSQLGDGSRPQVVLIEGAPGVGKTTFAWHQCRQWAEGKLLQAYSIVLLLPLRDGNIRQISSLPGLFRHSRGQVREEVSRRVAESGGAGCLIWLEAWDELPGDLRSNSLFIELIRGIQLPAATIFITSRPWATGGLLGRVRDRLSQHTELLTLTKEEVENIIIPMIVAIQSQTSFDSGFDFSEFIESNPMIRAAMYTPVSAAIVEQVFKSAPHNPPTTVTGLYSAFVLMRLEQHLSDHLEYCHMNIKVKTLADLPERVLGDLQRLCGLAYEAMSQQMIVFSSLPEGVSTLGLLQTVPQVYDEGEDRVSYNFLHYTVQEYLAALHLSHLQPQQLMTIIDTNTI